MLLPLVVADNRNYEVVTMKNYFAYSRVGLSVAFVIACVNGTVLASDHDYPPIMVPPSVSKAEYYALEKYHEDPICNNLNTT